MKFDFATFSTVARGAFYKEFDHFCTCGDIAPASALECAFGMGCLSFIKIVKDSLFENNDESKELSVDEFDDICCEAFEKATEGLTNPLPRIGLVGLLANITLEIKRYYKLFNDKEEE